MEGVGERLYRRTFPFMLLDVGIVALLLMGHVNIFSPVIAIIAGLGSIGAVSYIILGAFRFREAQARWAATRHDCLLRALRALCERRGHRPRGRWSARGHVAVHPVRAGPTPGEVLPSRGAGP